MVKSVVVLIGGGHAAGKKTTAQLLKQEIETTLSKARHDVQLIDMNLYKDTHPNKTIDSSTYSTSKSAAITVSNGLQKYPPLKPSRFDFEKLKSDLLKFEDTPDESPQKIFIVHGLYSLYDKELRSMSQIKVFIDSDPDTRLIRWIRRDVLGVGLPEDSDKASLESVINAYLQGARAEMSDFIFPTKEFADVIMPRGAEANAVKLIFDGIVPHLADKHSQPERMYLPHASGNYLRPTGNNSDIFEQEKFDVQKNKFYELN
ncbi:Uridine kinase (Uridine monophosphokinase) conserved hypothetical protein [Scheffersomyces stipitis CBS 6054]|uniref:Phosphoribulokinase/uridine kinase domain-containing protein n=1 Tax=Scheffersomyces stipitis (strain ATCC 58785 / CBS 6054 / NBRC 10063 / NRRL Y-11545) TaxID=322104 RepID=A3GFV2_PICST|nr:Uridine kinase (Uridine monophosphokinase) conserved hypothetical protein [Scheffersomyces stipitis CBS 6054]EAZ63825.2 Uridine kinase (Uridine monophosphokinase) conserved hypothetical protein [Scheffersomyces stipitis CBS 6054]KAG2735207.1 hypothetical protein G9P44_001421 [Scheffersomyces stipitis]